MKTLNFFKKTFFAVLVVALSAGFTACSDDDNENPIPDVPVVKQLPSVIAITSIEDKTTETEKYTYEYNAANQLIKVVYQSTETTEAEEETDETTTKTNTITYSLIYNEAGVLTQVKEKDGERSEVTTSYTYDQTNKTVSISDGYETTVYALDANGCLASSENDKYTYDAALNLLKYTENSKYESYTHEYIATYTYANVYSPYVSVDLPNWFISLDETNMFPGEAFAGKNLPATFNSTYTNVSSTETYKENYSGVVTVTKSENSYPLTMTVSTTGIFEETGKDNITSISTGTYNIEYIAAK